MIKEGSIRVIVKPNSNKNELVGFDNKKRAYIIRIKARPEKGKANTEITEIVGYP